MPRTLLLNDHHVPASGQNKVGVTGSFGQNKSVPFDPPVSGIPGAVQSAGMMYGEPLSFNDIIAGIREIERDATSG